MLKEYATLSKCTVKQICLQSPVFLKSKYFVHCIRDVLAMSASYLVIEESYHYHGCKSNDQYSINTDATVAITTKDDENNIQR